MQPGELLRYFKANPTAFSELVNYVNRERDASSRITQPSANNFQDIPPVDSVDGKLVTIPIQFTQTIQQITAYSATANGTYSQSQIQTLMDKTAEAVDKINSILSQFTASNINPGGGT